MYHASISGYCRIADVQSVAWTSRLLQHLPRSFQIQSNVVGAKFIFVWSISSSLSATVVFVDGFLCKAAEIPAAYFLLLVLAALCSRCGHYIFALWFLSSIFLFPRLISAAADWMSTILDTWCGPSANLECMSETYCVRLAGNAEHKKSPKTHHLGTIAQLFPAISLQLRHISTIRKKLVKQQYLLHMSPQYGEL